MWHRWKCGRDEGRAGRLISLTGTTTQQVVGSIPAIPASRRVRYQSKQLP